MFPATQWTQLVQATLHGDGASRAALDSLCRTYREPIRQVILMKGWARDEAEDLAQSFLLYLMEQSVLQKVDRERGRFRTFLQGVLSHWLTDEYRRRHAQKRGGGQTMVPLEDLHLPEHPLDPDPFQAEFDRHWARAVMATSLARVQAECLAKHGDDGAAVIGVFFGAGGEALSYEDAGRKTGLSPAAFKSEVHLWRRRLREQLRAEVRRNVSAPHEIDEDMSYLRSLLAHS